MSPPTGVLSVTLLSIQFNTSYLITVWYRNLNNRTALLQYTPVYIQLSYVQWKRRRRWLTSQCRLYSWNARGSVRNLSCFCSPNLEPGRPSIEKVSKAIVARIYIEHPVHPGSLIHEVFALYRYPSANSNCSNEWDLKCKPKRVFNSHIGRSLGRISDFERR